MSLFAIMVARASQIQKGGGERGREGAHLLQELQVAVRVTRFSFSGGAEYGCDVGVALGAVVIINRRRQRAAQLL
jgi:hypothetical protein